MTWKNVYSARLSRHYYVAIACAMLVAAGFAVDYLAGGRVPSPVETRLDIAIVQEVPRLISPKDKALYQEIFRAQKAADWAAADAAIAELSNDILLGHVLGERYLHRRYDTTNDELAMWLKRYGDHPQAQDIYELALHKKPELQKTIAAPAKQTKLQGYGDGTIGDMRFDGEPQARRTWQAGLNAWRAGKKAEAATYFSELTDKPDALSDWQLSAAHFWAYRAYSALNEDDKAKDHLEAAGKDPRSFYGILARKQLGDALGLDANGDTLDADELATIMHNNRMKQAIALAQAGLNERAEAMLRSLFPQADSDGKWLLLKLARALDLASVQISMAKQLESEDKPLDYAKYPVPHWQPNGGFNVDPALLYALMRQESGFRASAIGPGGSLGLMQLMPSTASMMQRSAPLSGSASDPVQNITLGERYVAHLLSNDLVDGNLFYMLAAYNAGPARLKEWRENIDYNDDPLLFAESIPYSVTRHYVMQVMTNYWIYSELVGSSGNSAQALLKGSWPLYYAQSTD